MLVPKIAMSQMKASLCFSNAASFFPLQLPNEKLAELQAIQKRARRESIQQDLLLGASPAVRTHTIIEAHPGKL